MELNRELGPEETGRIKSKWSRAGILIKHYSSYSAFDVSCLRSDFCIINQKEILIKSLGSGVSFFFFSPPSSLLLYKAHFWQISHTQFMNEHQSLKKQTPKLMVLSSM